MFDDTAAVRKTVHLGTQCLKYYPPDDPYFFALASKTDTYSDASPYKVIDVDPEDVLYCSLRGFDKFSEAGKVYGGNWDRKLRRFDESSFYPHVDSSFHEMMRLRFEADRPWEETPFIGEVERKIRRDGSCWGCASTDEVREKCREIDALYQSIREHGYLSQIESVERSMDGETPSLSEFVKKRTIFGRDEVTIDVARDGELLFFDGKHRLSIAKILGLDSIPMRVAVRHREWQRRRDRHRSNGTDIDRDQCAHPDLRDVR